MAFVFYGILLVFLAILAKGILIVDEEMILIISVLIFLGSSYNAVSGFLVSSLSDRAEAIHKTFNTYFLSKITTLTLLLGTYQKVYDTNADLVKVIGFTSNKLFTIRDVRNNEVEQFVNFLINNQLNIIISEELNLLRALYYMKIKLFFQNLLLNWKLYDIRSLVAEDSFLLDGFDKASGVIKQNKLALLPLSSMSSSDLSLFNYFGRIGHILDLSLVTPNYLSSYILVQLVLGLRVLR